MKIDKAALIKAIGICAMSWLAVPVIYYILVKRKPKEEEVKENEG